MQTISLLGARTRLDRTSHRSRRILSERPCACQWIRPRILIRDPRSSVTAAQTGRGRQLARSFVQVTDMFFMRGDDNGDADGVVDDQLTWLSLCGLLPGLRARCKTHDPARRRFISRSRRGHIGFALCLASPQRDKSVESGGVEN